MHTKCVPLHSLHMQKQAPAFTHTAHGIFATLNTAALDLCSFLNEEGGIEKILSLISRTEQKTQCVVSD